MGFDLNDDGVIGQAGIDDLICGDTSGSGIQANDVDVDGFAEDEIYVDCDGGIDFSGCGGPDNPCATVTYAFNTRANGTGSGNYEDIVCFTGTCRDVDSLTPAVGGLPGHWIKPRSGSEVRDWQFPANPAMLVGWDTDNDNRYPPFDADDTAVLDGGAPNYRAKAFDFENASLNSYLELAHFTVVDYGHVNGSGTDTGFIDPEASSHAYLHDLELERINRDQPLDSSRITFNLFGCPDHFAVINVDAVDIGAYFIRGSCGYGPSTSGPMRWQNLSYRAHGKTGGGATFVKLWGYNQGLEFLDSALDGNVHAWQPCDWGGGCGTVGFQVAQCSRDWTIRNNELDEMIVGLSVQGYATGFCDGANARTVDDIVFDRNRYSDDSGYWLEGINIITIADGGGSSSETSEDIAITNNFLTTSSYGTCLYYGAGNNGGSNPGTITFAHNTCHGDLIRAGWPAFYLDDARTHKHQNWEINNNIFSGNGPADINVITEWAPSGWDSDHNVFNPGSTFVWNNGQVSGLLGWRRASGGDKSSDTCEPAFVDAAGGDLQLAPADECARDRGSPLSGIGVDIDLDPRPGDPTVDASADEVPDSGTEATIALVPIGAHAGRIRGPASGGSCEAPFQTAAPQLAVGYSS